MVDANGEVNSSGCGISRFVLIQARFIGAFKLARLNIMLYFYYITLLHPGELKTFHMTAHRSLAYRHCVVGLEVIDSSN